MKKRIRCLILILIIIFVLFVIHQFLIQSIDNFDNRGDIQRKMKQYNVIFSGCCRNVEPHMNNILNHIERCAQKFNKYSLIVYENDSTDKTREILNSRKRENYYYIFENDVTEPSRTARIARGRNFILDKARELNATNDYDLLIMLDLDIVNAAGTFADTIDTCFEHENWDALTANQDTYYDLWALRNADLNYDCWKEIDAENKSCLDLNELKYKPGQLIEVDSAFGGTAVYKLSSIPLECRYVGKRENGEEICEHVPFNKCIKSGGGKIFINTSFINDGGSDLH